MAEAPQSIHALPKHYPDRNAVAGQIRSARRIDRGVGETNWVDFRDGVDYITLFDGLMATLQYVRDVGKSKTVLDIGIGSSEGIQDIAQSVLGEGLTWKATALTRPQGAQDVLLTSAEMLRGVEPDSIGCVLAAHSITYSAVPELVVQRIDDVLVEGGIIKAVFKGKNTNGQISAHGAQRFSEALLAHGFDVAWRDRRNENEKGLAELLLARKPFKDESRDPFFITAAELMQDDTDFLEQQMNLVRKK